jgi:phosphoglycolate phosphatase
MFDFDGTLADSLPWFLQLTNQAADKYRFRRVAESDINTLRGYSARQIMQYLGVPVWKVPLIAHYMRKRTAEGIGQIKLFDGIDQLIQRMSEREVTLAVVTANSYPNVQRVLGPELAARITYYECSVPLFGKSTRFRKILSQSGVAPHETLCIGDELRDFEAAKKVQLPFGAVTWGFTTTEALTAVGPTELFSSVADMMQKLTAQPHAA